MSLKQIFGRGLKAAAQDAETKPEDLADMATEFAALGKKAEDVKADDKTNKAKDAEVEKPPVEKRVETPKAEDRHAMDRRKAMHDALDKMLAREEELGGGHEAEDVDLDELGELVTQFLQEEKGEAEHQDVPPIEAESEEQSVEADGANPLPPDEEAEALAADRRVRAADRFLDGKSQVRTSDAREILDTLRRGIARTGDRDLIRQFNGLASRFTRSSRSSNGAYGSFARSAAAVRTGDVGPDRYKNRNEFAPAGANRTLTAAQQQELQEAYNKRRSTNMEVKQ